MQVYIITVYIIFIVWANKLNATVYGFFKLLIYTGWAKNGTKFLYANNFTKY